MIGPDTELPRLAVIGCGMWGRNHVRTAASLGALVAVVDADAEVAAAVAEQNGSVARSLDAVLADESIDGVVIAAPAVDHARLALDALHAGKHVLVEKPLALTVDDAERVVEAGRTLGRTVMVGHLLHFHPAFLALADLMRDGALGQPRYLYSHRLNLGRFRREENSLWSFAPHDISMVLALVGEEPDHVSAVGSTYLTRSVPDVTTTHLEFPSGPSGHVFVSWLHPFKEQRLVVVGSDAMAVFDDLADWPDKLRVYEHGVSWRDGVPQPIRAEATPIALTPDEPLRREVEHFLHCVATGERPRTDGEEGVRVLRVLARAQESLGLDASGGSGRSGASAGPPPSDGPARSDGAARFPGVRIHESAVVDDDVTIGAGTAVWHFSHVLSGVSIGAECTLGQNVVVGPDVTVGDRCRIQNNVSVYAGVTLEDGVFCGPSCVFTNVYNPRAEVSRKSEFLPTLVRRGATLGANSTIVCGVTIGEYAFVGAGAVVTNDVDSHALVVGNPARPIGWMSHDGERLGDDLVCARSGRRYEIVDGHLVERTDVPDTAGQPGSPQTTSEEGTS